MVPLAPLECCAFSAAVAVQRIVWCRTQRWRRLAGPQSTGPPRVQIMLSRAVRPLKPAQESGVNAAEPCSPPVLCTGQGLPEVLKDGLQASLLLVGRQLCSADTSLSETLPGATALSLHVSASAVTAGEAAAMRNAPLRRLNAGAGCVDTRRMCAGPRPCPAHTLRLGSMHNISAGPVPSLALT